MKIRLRWCINSLPFDPVTLELFIVYYIDLVNQMQQGFRPCIGIDTLTDILLFIQSV